MIHWTQDQDCCSRSPTIAGIANADSFSPRDILQVSQERATLRKVDVDQVDTIGKAANPGEFKDEHKWADWYPAFVNYLSPIPGVYGVPLSYIARDNDAPDQDTDFGDDFTAVTVASASLQGPRFQADARKVHQLLKNFLLAESAEQWICDIDARADGRQDTQALHKHYEGEGNTSRCIALAMKYHETLHYRSERALQGSNFLDHIERINSHPQLEGTVKALKVRHAIEGMTYTQAANPLSLRQFLNSRSTRLHAERKKSTVSEEDGLVTKSNGMVVA